MRFHAKLLLAGLTAALVLATAIGTASANRLSLSERQFQIIWSTPLSSGGGGDTTAECAITLTGSFHASTFQKVVGALLGFVNTAAVGRAETCTRGAMTVLRETLPWHLTYDSFTGRLPAITGVTVQTIGASFQIEEGFGIRCLFRTTTTNPNRFTANLDGSGTVTFLRAGETETIPMTGGILCPTTGRFTGEGGSIRTPGGRSFVITLI